ncbi:hypothetical protein RIR_jg35007.t1 [Rhizophagus irregularis DAOM 181602=DAOM 197198]|nr:hypothetical protein RIR_jg35007.t1 [Rhizophagus irregularis DAOM 181602=DAOM 197198]
MFLADWTLEMIATFLAFAEELVEFFAVLVHSGLLFAYLRKIFHAVVRLKQLFQAIKVFLFYSCPVLSSS